METKRSLPSIAPRVAATPGTGLRPVLLALAGDSASGKSTLSRGIEFILGVGRVGRVCTDDYHRYDRSARAELSVTPLAPEANRMDLMAEHLRTLAAGAPVTKPTYDHHTGTFGPDETIGPGEIVIIECQLQWNSGMSLQPHVHDLQHGRDLSFGYAVMR